MKKHFTQLVFTFLAIAIMSQMGVAQTYIWGGPGDPNSEFNGGLNDWTVNAVSPNDSAAWVWEADGKADRGAYSGAGSVIVSPSVNNGAVVFDSDYYDNAGIQGNFGNGPAAAPQLGELVSPEFSCEGAQSVWLKFNQSYRHFTNSVTKINVSIDGGATWGSDYIVNSSIAVNAATSSDSEILLNISDQAADQANVRFKFVFDANYYFWIIDDVYVIGDPKGDPQIVGTWYPPNRYNNPQSQIANDSMFFIMDVINKGGSDNMGIGAKVSLLNLDSELTLFEDSTTFDLAVGDTIQLEFNSFMPPMNMDTGEHVAIYEVFPSDAATGDGKRYLQYFRVNDGMLESNEAGIETYGNLYAIGDGDATGAVSFQGSGAAGPVQDVYDITYYKMGDWATNSNVSFRATEANLAITMGTDGDIISFPVSMFMFEVVDTVDNQLFNWNFTDGIVVDGNESTQLTYVGYAAENKEDIPKYDWVSVPLTSADDEYDFVELKPNTKYFIASLWPKGERYYHAYDNGFSGYNRFFYDQRLSLVYLDDGSGARFYTIGYDEYGSWQQSMNMKMLINTATQDELLPANSVIFAQNPVRNDLTVNISFENTVEKATMVIHDLNGSIIDMRNINNLKEDKQSFNVGQLPTGTYIFTLFTNDKLISKKFIVTK